MSETIKIAPSFSVAIFVAGDIDVARRICRRHTMEVGLCVTVMPTEFIYTGGAETGVCIGLVNYPRFPKPASEIKEQANKLAVELRDELFQHTVLVVDQHETTWFTRREQQA